MDVKDLKFLLKLLSYQNYQVSFNKINLESEMKVSEKNKICSRLGDQGLVKFTREVTKINIEPKGTSLLNNKKAVNSLTTEELKVLKATAKGTISPAETGLDTSYRKAVITDLLEQGLIKVIGQKIKEVWLTETGKQFLCQEYSSGSTAKEISLKMLSDYLDLMRSNCSLYCPKQEKQQFSQMSDKPTDSEILAVIRDLDQNLGTNNYLPIFHLRHKLQPPLSREEVDLALYRLEKSDQIELSSLQEVISYTPEEFEAGIPQDIGGRLFFIIPY